MYKLVVYYTKRFLLARPVDIVLHQLQRLYTANDDGEMIDIGRTSYTVTPYGGGFVSMSNKDLTNPGSVLKHLQIATIT